VHISVRLFAGAAQLAGTSQLELELSSQSTAQRKALVSDVVLRLLEQIPQLSSLLKNSRWAVDDDFVELNHVLQDGQMLAMIPPVSGG
jgi:sulfur-carrier protein